MEQFRIQPANEIGLVGYSHSPDRREHESCDKPRHGTKKGHPSKFTIGWFQYANANLGQKAIQARCKALAMICGFKSLCHVQQRRSEQVGQHQVREQASERSAALRLYSANNCSGMDVSSKDGGVTANLSENLDWQYYAQLKAIGRVQIVPPLTEQAVDWDVPCSS